MGVICCDAWNTEAGIGGGSVECERNALVGCAGDRTRCKVDAIVVEVELSRNGLVGCHLDLGHDGLGDNALRSVGHKGEVGCLVVEGEVVSTATLGGDCRATVTTLTDVAGIVGYGLVLLRLDGYLVARGAVLTRITHGIAGGGEIAGEVKLSCGCFLVVRGLGCE